MTEACADREAGTSIPRDGKEWALWESGDKALNVGYNGENSLIDFSDIETATGVSGLPSESSDSGLLYVRQYSGVVTRTICLRTSPGRYVPYYTDQSGSVRAKMYFHPTGRGVSNDYTGDYYEIATIYDGHVSCGGLSGEEVLRLAYIQSNHRGDTWFMFSNKNVHETWRENRR